VFFIGDTENLDNRDRQSLYTPKLSPQKVGSVTSSDMDERAGKLSLRRVRWLRWAKRPSCMRGKKKWTVLPVDILHVVAGRPTEHFFYVPFWFDCLVLQPHAQSYSVHSVFGIWDNVWNITYSFWATKITSGAPTELVRLRQYQQNLAWRCRMCLRSAWWILSYYPGSLHANTLYRNWRFKFHKVGLVERQI